MVDEKCEQLIAVAKFFVHDWGDIVETGERGDMGEFSSYVSLLSCWGGVEAGAT